MLFDLLKYLFQVTNMTHSDSVHTGGCCCHRIVMQFDEIKNELQNVRQTVGVAVTLLSVSRKVICCESILTCHCKIWTHRNITYPNLDTQTHNISKSELY